MSEHNSNPDDRHQIVFYISKPFQEKLNSFLRVFFNDKTFNQPVKAQ